MSPVTGTPILAIYATVEGDDLEDVALTVRNFRTMETSRRPRTSTVRVTAELLEDAASAQEVMAALAEEAARALYEPLATELRRLRAGQEDAAVDCPACEGTGDEAVEDMVEEREDVFVVRKRLTGRKCPHCGGRKRVRADEAVDIEARL